MLVAGFVDARLVYIFKFEFDEPEFVEHLNRQLARKFPDGDVSGIFLRSASFSFRNFKDCASLETFCFVNKNELDNLRGHIVRDLYAHLRRFAQ